jgi:phosphate transport system protein
MTDHTVKAFDEDITRLRGLVAEMGGLSELAITKSMDALVRGDADLAKDVIVHDRRINELNGEIDRLSIRVLALRAPMADDLREVVATLKIAGELERIGDYAKNIAKRVGEIEGRKKFEPLTLLPAMAEIASEMVHDVLTAYAARDPVLASEVMDRDAKVDAFYESIFRNLLTHMMENPPSITSAAQLLFVARNLERVGDHATNIAEMVHYAATGRYLPDREEAGEAGRA